MRTTPQSTKVCRPKFHISNSTRLQLELQHSTPAISWRSRDYQSRRKELGGSTAINFCVWTKGPRSDYERWAQVVDDEAWNWQMANERYKKVCLDFIVMMGSMRAKQSAQKSRMRLRSQSNSVNTSTLQTTIQNLRGIFH